MARDAKIEVAAINIRIPETHERNYTALIKALSEQRRGIRVRGDTYLAVNYFEEDTGIGVLSKYTEIDIDGDWFDLEDFGVASSEKVDEINIPENLRPNLSQFWFKLDPEIHVVSFSRYSESRSVSTKSVERYFREAVNWKTVREVFGTIEVDIVKSYGEVENILSLPDLKELSLVIKRPNADDIPDDLAHEIERRLREQGADEYEERTKVRGSGEITPNERTKKLALVAAENGQVRAKSIVNGVMTESNTEDRPLVEVATFKNDEAERNIFTKVSQKIFDKIRKAREALRG